jgi:hypothetical protein
MPLNYGTYGRGQRIYIERARDTERPHQVVGRGPRFQLIKKPKPLLGKGSWKSCKGHLRSLELELLCFLLGGRPESVARIGCLCATKGLGLFWTAGKRNSVSRISANWAIMVMVAQIKRVILREIRDCKEPANSPKSNESAVVGISIPETCHSSEKIYTSIQQCAVFSGTKMSLSPLVLAEVPVNYPFHFFTILQAESYTLTTALDEPSQELGYTKNLPKYTSRGTISRAMTSRANTVIDSRRL